MTSVAVTRAWARARRLYTSEAFRKTYVRGALAALAGKPADACPYRKRSGWAWRRIWLSGYMSVATSDD